MGCNNSGGRIVNEKQDMYEYGMGRVAIGTESHNIQSKHIILVLGPMSISNSV